MKIVFSLLLLLPCWLQAEVITVPSELSGRVLLILAKENKVETVVNGHGLRFSINTIEQSHDIYEPKYNGRFLKSSTIILPNDSGLILELYGPVDPNDQNERSSNFQRNAPHTITYLELRCEEMGKTFRISLAAGVNFPESILNELKSLDKKTKSANQAVEPTR